MATVTFWKGTRVAYDALDEKLDTRLYFLEDEGLLYKGATVFSPIQSNDALGEDSTDDTVPGSKAVVDFVSGGFVPLDGYVALTQEEKDKLSELYGKEALDALLANKVSSDDLATALAGYDTSEQVTAKINDAVESIESGVMSWIEG